MVRFQETVQSGTDASAAASCDTPLTLSTGRKQRIVPSLYVSVLKDPGPSDGSSEPCASPVPALEAAGPSDSDSEQPSPLRRDNVMFVKRRNTETMPISSAAPRLRNVLPPVGARMFRLSNARELS